MKDVIAMSDFLVEKLATLGIKAEQRAIGSHILEGKDTELPPVVIAETGKDPKKASITSYSRL